MKTSRIHLLSGISLLATTLCAMPALAQSVSETITLPQVTVSGQQAKTVGNGSQNHLSPLDTALPKNLPAVVEGRSKKQLDKEVNAVTTAELLKYLPSIEVRERAVGDTNGIIATRTTGTVSSADTLVYADEQLISDLLGNSYSWPPRWGLVSPEEIQRIDVMYGPFSALYPGNSEGGVVTLTTRIPDKLEAHVDITGTLQPFKLYGTNQLEGSGRINAAFGDRVGALSYWFSVDHLDAYGQPLSFSTDELATGKALTRSATPVSGYYQDIDQNGLPRYVFGAYSVVHSVQNQLNLKLAYDFNDTTRLIYTLGYWSNSAADRVQTFLTTGAGTPFYNGTVAINGKDYTVSGLDPSQVSENNISSSIALRTDTQGQWDWDISGSFYRFLNDDTLAATNYGQTTAGTATQLSGTGWETADVRGIWRPQWDFADTHEVSFGVHFDSYQLDQTIDSLSNWAVGGTGPRTGLSVGTTATSAVYLQDEWRFLPRWMLVLGGREEFWWAYGGENATATSAFNYSARSANSFSPKVSVAVQATDRLNVRLSTGLAYRYPTVTELFQQVTATESGTSVIVNDPNLLPERDLAFDLTAQYAIDQGTLRASLFDSELHNALFAQTDTTVTPNVTEVENIDKARIYGAEVAVVLQNVFVTGLGLEGGVTYASAHTLKDTQNPSIDGKVFPRIPEWRVRGVITYQPVEDWTFAFGLRYASASFSQLNNSDINPNTYGGISQYLVTDIRVTHKLKRGITVAVGVDNMNDCKYYVSPHPYPQTTAFLELKWDT